MKTDDIELMKKIYHLSTCDTCQRILKELQPLDGFELQDIKSIKITRNPIGTNVSNGGEL